MPTLRACAGFESGVSDLTSLTKGNNGNKLFDLAAGSPTMVSAGAVRTGTYALELNPSAAVEYVAWSNNTFGSTTVLVAGVAFRFPGSLPANDCVIVYCQNDAATDSTILFRNSDDRIIACEDGGAQAEQGPVLAADTWYWLDLRYNVSAAVHTIDWQVDGVAQTQYTSSTLVAANVLGLGLGDMFNTQTMTCRYDDAVISATSGDYPLGPHAVRMLIPDTAGSTAQIGTANATGRMVTNSAIDSTHNSANILTAISEVPPLIGASATGVGQRTSGSGNAVGIPMTTYTLAGGETISGVRVMVVGWAGSTTAASIGLRTHNGTTESTLFAAADPNFDNNTTSPAWLCKMTANSDFDTQTELDALVVRLGYSTDISPLPGAHAIYAEVAVKQSAGGVTGAASAALGFTATASGVPRTGGAATASFGFTGTASGVDRALGAAVTTFGYTATAQGVDRALGQASAVFGFTAAAAGTPDTPPVIGTAQGSFGFTATANGVPRTRGAAAGTFGFTAAAQGVDRALGTAVALFGFTSTAAGRPRVVALAVAAFGFTATTAGTRRVRGAASGSFGFTGTAQGFPGSPPTTGAASGLFGFVATAHGQPRTSGAASAGFGFTATANGRPRVVAVAVVTFGFTAEATGTRVVLGAAQATFGFTAFGTGQPPVPPDPETIFDTFINPGGSTVTETNRFTTTVLPRSFVTVVEP